MLPTRGIHPPRSPCSNPTLSIFHLSRASPTHPSMPFCGGEGGIRTHGPIAGTHAFQACRFVHSRTSPQRFSRGGILTRVLMTGKVTAGAHRDGFAPLNSPLSVTVAIFFASIFLSNSNSFSFFRHISVAE